MYPASCSTIHSLVVAYISSLLVKSLLSIYRLHYGQHESHAVELLLRSTAIHKKKCNRSDLRTMAESRIQPSSKIAPWHLTSNQAPNIEHHLRRSHHGIDALISAPRHVIAAFHRIESPLHSNLPLRTMADARRAYNCSNQGLKTPIEPPRCAATSILTISSLLQNGHRTVEASSNIKSNLPRRTEEDPPAIDPIERTMASIESIPLTFPLNPLDHRNERKPPLSQQAPIKRAPIEPHFSTSPLKGTYNRSNAISAPSIASESPPNVIMASIPLNH
jgi:hypothetical protein